eukprot:m.34194 g.34194  ORF g.34194 m.34194 type:complete len:291 (+) comp9745_c0_seq1:467-1339(+)
MGWSSSALSCLTSSFILMFDSPIPCSDASTWLLTVHTSISITVMAQWGEAAGGFAEDFASAQEEVSTEGLPAPEETVDHGNGIKKVVSYYRRGGKVYKKTSTFRVETIESPISPAIRERRQWTKFGLAEGKPSGPEEDTTRIGEEVFLELHGEKAQSDKPKQDATATSTISCRHCGGSHFTAKCPVAGQMAASTEETYTAPQTSSFKTHHNEGYGVRISDLPMDVMEDEVRELCSKFRPIRTFVPKDKVTGEPRGFAYVRFATQKAAEDAVSELDGQGFNHVIIHANLSD